MPTKNDTIFLILAVLRDYSERNLHHTHDSNATKFGIVHIPRTKEYVMISLLKTWNTTEISRSDSSHAARNGNKLLSYISSSVIKCKKHTWCVLDRKVSPRATPTCEETLFYFHNGYAENSINKTKHMSEVGWDYATYLIWFSWHVLVRSLCIVLLNSQWLHIQNGAHKLINTTNKTAQ